MEALENYLCQQTRASVFLLTALIGYETPNKAYCFGLTLNYYIYAKMYYGLNCLSFSIKI